MGPAYFIDIHFCSVYYPKQTEDNSHSEMYTYILGGGGGSKYAKKIPHKIEKHFGKRLEKQTCS